MIDGIQRRSAAIVAADMVGYSRLMGADEADLLGAHRLFRAWDERYRALHAAKSVSIR